MSRIKLRAATAKHFGIRISIYKSDNWEYFKLSDLNNDWTEFLISLIDNLNYLKHVSLFSFYMFYKQRYYLLSYTYTSNTMYTQGFILSNATEYLKVKKIGKNVWR